MVLIWVTFFSPSWSADTDIKPHTWRCTQTNMEKYAHMDSHMQRKQILYVLW